MTAMRMAECHPDRPYWARGFCSSCVKSDYRKRHPDYRQPSGGRTREQNRVKAHQRRAAMHAVAFEPVAVSDIAARDGWVCWLCGLAHMACNSGRGNRQGGYDGSGSSPAPSPAPSRLASRASLDPRVRAGDS